ncbi:hypothetical protein ACOMHN_057954 [Nucella lapillus]
MSKTWDDKDDDDDDDDDDDKVDDDVQNWKMDVQNQIACIATNLTYSLQHYPHPEVGRQFDYSDKVVQAQMEKKKKLQSSEEGGNTLLYGLAKVRHAQQS